MAGDEKSPVSEIVAFCVCLEPRIFRVEIDAKSRAEVLAVVQKHKAAFMKYVGLYSDAARTYKHRITVGDYLAVTFKYAPESEPPVFIQLGCILSDPTVELYSETELRDAYYGACGG